MNTSFKQTALAACSILAITTSQAFAQSEVIQDADINLTVQNQFTLVYTTEMDFGTWAVFCDTAAANSTTLTMSVAGVVSPGIPDLPAQVFLIDATGTSQGIFDITDAAPNTALTVTSGDLQNMTCALCGGGNPVITLTSIALETGGAITTDLNGDFEFDVGAVLTTLGTCGTQYADGLYEGSFDLTVSY